MNKERILSILLAPHVSEKTATTGGDYGQYAFRVASDANKLEIREAVEQLFNVKVRNLRVCNMKGKNVTFGRRKGKRSDWKKAYVTLEKDQEIDIVGQVA